MLEDSTSNEHQFFYFIFWTNKYKIFQTLHNLLTKKIGTLIFEPKSKTMIFREKKVRVKKINKRNIFYCVLLNTTFGWIVKFPVITLCDT